MIAATKVNGINDILVIGEVMVDFRYENVIVHVRITFVFKIVLFPLGRSFWKFHRSPTAFGRLFGLFQEFLFLLIISFIITASTFMGYHILGRELFRNLFQDFTFLLSRFLNHMEELFVALAMDTNVVITKSGLVLEAHVTVWTLQPFLLLFLFLPMTVFHMPPVKLLVGIRLVTNHTQKHPISDWNRIILLPIAILFSFVFGHIGRRFHVVPVFVMPFQLLVVSKTVAADATHEILGPVLVPDMIQQAVSGLKPDLASLALKLFVITMVIADMPPQSRFEFEQFAALLAWKLIALPSMSSDRMPFQLVRIVVGLGALVTLERQIRFGFRRRLLWCRRLSRFFLLPLFSSGNFVWIQPLFHSWQFVCTSVSFPPILYCWFRWNHVVDDLLMLHPGHHRFKCPITLGAGFALAMSVSKMVVQSSHLLESSITDLALEFPKLLMNAFDVNPKMSLESKAHATYVTLHVIGFFVDTSDVRLQDLRPSVLRLAQVAIVCDIFMNRLVVPCQLRTVPEVFVALLAIVIGFHRLHWILLNHLHLV